MSAMLLTTLGVGIGLAVLIVAGQRAAAAESRAIRKEMAEDRRAIRSAIEALGERIARLEGAFPFLAARFPDPGAKPPDEPAA